MPPHTERSQGLLISWRTLGMPFLIQKQFYLSLLLYFNSTSASSPSHNGQESWLPSETSTHSLGAQRHFGTLFHIDGHSLTGESFNLDCPRVTFKCSVCKMANCDSLLSTHQQDRGNGGVTKPRCSAALYFKARSTAVIGLSASLAHLLTSSGISRPVRDLEGNTNLFSY